MLSWVEWFFSCEVMQIEVFYKNAFFQHVQRFFDVWKIFFFMNDFMISKWWIVCFMNVYNFLSHLCIIY